MTRIILCESRGTEINPNAMIQLETDFKTYRELFYGLSINNDPAILSAGIQKNYYRQANKKTGKQLKKPILEKCSFLLIDTQYTNNSGCYRNLEIGGKIHAMKLKPTYKNISNIINSYFRNNHNFDYPKLTKIKYINNFNDLYKNAGFREKIILDNLIYIETVETPPNYEVYKFYGMINGEIYSCEIDFLNNYKIIG